VAHTKLLDAIDAKCGDVPFDVLRSADGLNLEVTPGLAMTVNGGGAQMFAGVTAGLKVSLGDGLDALTIENVDLQGKLAIATGKGSDGVLIEESRFRADAEIDLGADNNTLAICSNIFDMKLAIKCGTPIAQNVEVECPVGLSPFSSFGSAIALDDLEVQGPFSIKGGKGFENVAIQRSTVGPTKLALGVANRVALCTVVVNGALDVALGGGQR